MKDKYKSIYNAAKAYRKKEESAVKPSDYDFGVDDEYLKSFYDELTTFYDNASKDYDSLDFGSDVSSLYGKYSSSSSSLREKANNIRAYLNANKSNIDKTEHGKLIADLDSYVSFLDNTTTAFKNASDFYSRYETKYDYDAFVMNNTSGASNGNSAKRTDAYKSVTARIAEIDEELSRLGYEGEYSDGKIKFIKMDDPGKPGKWDEVVSLTAEKEKLEAEVRKYERGNKTTDDLYTKYSVNEDWEEDASNRDFHIPTGRDLALYSTIDPKTGQPYLTDESKVIMEDPLGTYLAYAGKEDGHEQGIIPEIGIPNPTSAETDTHALQHVRAYNETINDGIEGNWSFLNADEVNLYYYMWSNGYKEEALSYLDGMQTELDRRATMKRQEHLEDAGFLEMVFHNVVSIPANIFGGALAFAEDAINLISGNDINPYAGGHSIQNYAQGVRQATANDINDFTGASSDDWITWGDAYQGIMSAADSVAGSLIFGTGYSAVMGTGAAASEAKRLYEEGASKGQIIAGGLLAGVAEAAFERISVGFFLDKVLGTPSKNVGQWLVKALGMGGVEASEELCTTLANYITDAAVRGSTSDWAKKIDEYKKQGYSDGQAIWEAIKEIGGESLHDAAVGFISGSFMGGTGSAASSVAYSKALKQQGTDIKHNGGVDALKTLAIEYAEELGGLRGKSLTKSANAISNDSKVKDIGAFSEKVGAASARLNKADIKSALIERGVSKAKAENYTNILVAMNEQYFKGSADKSSFTLGTDEQWQRMTGDKNAFSVLSDIVTNKESSVNKRNTKQSYAMNGIRVDAEGNAKAEDVAAFFDRKNEAVSNAGISTTLSDKDIDVSSDGKNIVGEKALDTLEFVDDNGTVKVKVDDNTSVDVGSVSYKSEGLGKVVATFVDMGIDAASVQGIVDMFDGVSAEDASLFASNVKNAFFYGRYNYGKANLSKLVGKYGITEEQAQKAYLLGEISSQAKTDKDSSAVKEQVEKAEATAERDEDGNIKAKHGKGEIIFEGDVSEAKMNEQRRKASLEGLKVLAELSPVRFHIFESTKDADGTYSFVMKNGKKMQASGWYVVGTRDIWIDINAGDNFEGTMLWTAAHEISHYIKEWNAKEWKVLADFLIEQYELNHKPVKTMLEHEIGKINKREQANEEAAKAAGKEYERMTETEIYDEAFEELVCEAMVQMFDDGTIVQSMAELKQKKPNVWKKIGEAIKNLLAKWGLVLDAYKGLPVHTREARAVAQMKDSFKKFQELYQKAFEGANYAASMVGNMPKAAANANSVVFGNRDAQIEKTESGVKNQLRNNEAIGKAAINYNNKHSKVNEAILATGVETMHEMAEAMIPFLDEEGILPPDIPGKTIFSNGSYGKTGENTTLCVRTLTYEDFKDRVSEKIGRPLTVAESLLVSQKIYDIATDPQCIYCYVAADRKAYDAYLGEYWNAMDKYIKALKDGGDSKALYEEYLNGRKDTNQQQKRWAMWESIAKNGKEYISAKDLTTKLKRDSIIAKKNAFSDQIKDAQRYAQSASWAKTVFDYRAYKGDILKMQQKFVDLLNSEYGLRMYSFSDYTPAFIVENMQMIIDASVKGLKSLAYTKDTDYAEIFASTGQAINVSCFAKYDKELGVYVEDNRQGANWAKTKELRKNHKNVGSVMVCTSDAMVLWALKQDWVDVVIPYHIVKTGTTIANEYGWNNYTSESADKINGRVANIYPTEHNNSFATYSKLLEERGITPRFSRYYAMAKDGKITEQQYMKLVNEVRLPASQLSPVVPKFNLDAAKKSFGIDNDGNVIKGGFVAKGGYMGGWYRQGVDVNQEVMQVSQDIAEGKSSLDVDYGMNKKSKEKVSEHYGIKTQMRDYVQTDSKAVMTTERIDYLIEDSGAGSRVDYANSWITSISPTDFLNMTLTLGKQDRAAFDKFPSEWNDDSNMDTYDYMGELKKNMRQTPYLAIDITTGEVVGHEGRHRMRALEREGIKSAEIRVEFRDEDGRTVKYSPDGKRLQIMDAVEITNQFGTGQTASITNVIPLNKDYRDTILANYGENTSTSDNDLRYQVREQFYDEFDAWDKKDTTIRFVVGTTSDVLLSIGMKDQNIILNSGTVLQKIKDHKEMTFDLFKGIPDLLERPIIVQFSDAIDPKTGQSKYDSRISVLGELYAEVDNNGKKEKRPVLVSLELTPTNKKRTMVLDFSIITSAYSKDALQRYLNENSILYIEPNKKRTDNWLSLNRLSLPLGENHYGSVRRITYLGKKVKIENSKHLTPMQKAMRDAGVADSFGNIKTQERNTDSNRYLLATALESAAKNEIELKYLKQFKEGVAQIDALETHLREVNAKIREISFSKGSRDKAELAKLRDEATKTVNRISNYDNRLLRLEANEPIKKLLGRERAKAYAKAKQEDRESFRKYREETNKRIDKIVGNYQESRKKAVDRVKETRAKNDAKAKLQQIVLETAKWISYPKKDDVKCPDIIRAPYADFLKGIDFSSKTLLEKGEQTKNDLRMASAMDSLATAIERIKTAQNPSVETDEVLDSGYLDLPAFFVDQVREMAEKIKQMIANVDGDFVVNKMSSDDIKQITKIIRTLNHSIREMSTLYSNLRFAKVDELGNNSISFMEEIGEADSTSAVGDFVSWDNALPYYAFKRFGESGESVFEELMDAQDKMAFLADEIIKFREKAWTSNESKSWSEDTHTIELPSGKELTLTTADAMSIYCLSRRDNNQGLNHLVGGGVRVLGQKNGAKETKDSRANLDLNDVVAICNSLDSRQKAVAESIQEFMSSVCSEWGNEISMKRFLTKDFTEKRYFPIQSNDEVLALQDPQAQQSDLFRLLNISATKPLTKKANNAVIVRNIFDVFTEHTSDMARLNAYGMALLDYMKWVNYNEKTTNDEGQISVRGVRSAMNKTYGKKALSYAIGLVKDINGRFTDNGDHPFLMKMARTAKTAAVGSSLRVAALQFTAYPRAAMALSTGNLVKGLGKRPQISKARKYCGIALWKSFGFYDTNIARSIEDQIKGTTNWRQKLIELSLKGAEWGDSITWGYLWNACEYDVATSNKSLKVGSEEFNQAVGKRLRDVIYSTQVVDSVLTRSQIMRSKSGLTQTATAFMSEATLTSNILMDAGFQFKLEKRRTGSAKLAWKKTGGNIMKTVAVFGTVQVITALVESLVDAYRDDDDEEFGEKFIDAFGTNMVADILPFNKIPILADVAEGVLSLVGLGYFSTDRLDTVWLADIVKACKSWIKVIGEAVGTKNTSLTAYKAIYDTAKAFSSATGVSFSGALRELVTLWNNTAGAVDPELKIKKYEN